MLTYAYLHEGARYLLETAEQVEEGSFYMSMLSLISTAFFLEAFLNHLGARRISYWDVLERALSPRAKLKILSANLGVEPDFSTRPYQSFTGAFKLRNFLAHGRTELLKGAWTDETAWERMCTPAEARRRCEDAEKIARGLHKKAGLAGDPFAAVSHGMFSRTVL